VAMRVASACRVSAVTLKPLGIVISSVRSEVAKI
jgi:hypothetical protein